MAMEMEMTIGKVFRDIRLKGAKEFEDITLSMQPREHQKSGLKQCLLKGTYGLWDDAGTGKSYISYMAAAVHIRRGNKVLAIMPPGLCEQYEEKFRESVGMEFTSYVVNETPAKRKEKYTEFRKTGWPDLLVIGYQMFLR